MAFVDNQTTQDDVPRYEHEEGVTRKALYDCSICPRG